MSDRSAIRSRTTRSKVLALLSAGVLVGIGATATLASWSDTEWVFGGVDGTTPGLGTSDFEVEQNRGSGWDQFESANGGALSLTIPALALTPGDATYTQVSLRTTVSSPASIAGTLDLRSAIQAVSPMPATDAALWTALRLRVVVYDGAPVTCNAAAFVGGTYVIGSEATPAAITTAGSLTRSLSALGANQQNYCFQVSLPAGSPDSLQGLNAAPVWEFHATSS